ncbi:hypothetical protein YTPLAS18_36100 [Nitrospira sp.]|nr:hypothetical protein YTPLAS18_36100 [Nitrospira sp.]
MRQRGGPLAMILCCLAWMIVAPAQDTLAMTQILPEAKIEVDRQTVLELTSTFDQAEEAIRSRDVDGLMSLYSERYAYHGLKKADIRSIWHELLQNYDLISNVHTFSSIKTAQRDGTPVLEITCTGALWATSKDSKARLPIDSWHREIHYLIKERGAWRIVGSAGAEAGSRPPKMFGTAPHPLF